MKIIKKYDTEQVFPYIAYVPDKLSEHPAIIFQLHGAGERGNGSPEQLDLVLKWGFTNSLSEDDFDDFILVMPQCPADTFWAARVESLGKFVDVITDAFSADNSRIYLCGLSMGGYGTWFTAMAYPQKFAAIAPCCGGGMPWNSRVYDMPIWAFHGSDDKTVDPSESLKMVKAVREAGGNIKFDLYDGVGHDSWKRAFTPPLVKWFLENKR